MGNNSGIEYLHQKRKEFANVEDYVRFLEKFIEETQKYINEVGGLTIETIDELSKFKGKKVSRIRSKIYQEIEKKYLELNEQGANTTYVIATNIIAKKYNKPRQKLYQAFNKWQNRQNAKSK